MKHKLPILIACMVLMLAPALASSADMFLKIEGVSGESQLASVAGSEIEILAFSWGAVRAATGGGGGAGKVSLSDFKINKKIDDNTTAFFAGLERGEAIRKVTLTHTPERGRTMTYELEDVRLSEITHSGEGESISLSFGSVKVTYKPQRGEARTFESGGDVARGRPMQRRQR